jgi:hydrogenase maturation protein HypF
MRIFEMCEACRAEYDSPLDRRFHAQPNACPACGPRLELWDKWATVLASGQEALQQAAESLCRGKILALKGLGGFQLLVDARNHEAVLRIRERKHREEKPFALMVPSLESVRTYCEASELEQRLLLSPIVPLFCSAAENRRVTVRHNSLSWRRPGQLYLGIMLPTATSSYSDETAGSSGLLAAMSVTNRRYRRRKRCND